MNEAFRFTQSTIGIFLKSVPGYIPAVMAVWQCQSRSHISLILKSRYEVVRREGEVGLGDLRNHPIHISWRIRYRETLGRRLNHCSCESVARLRQPLESEIATTILQNCVGLPMSHSRHLSLPHFSSFGLKGRVSLLTTPKNDYKVTGFKVKSPIKVQSPNITF